MFSFIILELVPWYPSLLQHVRWWHHIFTYLCCAVSCFNCHVQMPQNINIHKSATPYGERVHKDFNSLQFSHKRQPTCFGGQQHSIFIRAWDIEMKSWKDPNVKLELEGSSLSNYIHSDSLFKLRAYTVVRPQYLKLLFEPFQDFIPLF